MRSHDRFASINSSSGSLKKVRDHLNILRVHQVAFTSEQMRTGVSAINTVVHGRVNHRKHEKGRRIEVSYRAPPGAL